ncbi:hypothetical protein ACWD4O_42230 [Streptomyces sp. NPDC002623]
MAVLLSLLPAAAAARRIPGRHAPWLLAETALDITFRRDAHRAIPRGS